MYLQVTWRRAASLNPLTIGKMTFTEDKDYEVLHTGANNWNLLIKNVQPKHAGTYECQISTKDKMKRIVRLNVLGTPKSLFCVAFIPLNTYYYMLKKYRNDHLKTQS